MCILEAVININTGCQVVPHYCNKPIRDIYCTIGQPLRIVYTDGSFFTHEIVEDYKLCKYSRSRITTSRKIWIFKNIKQANVTK